MIYIAPPVGSGTRRDPYRPRGWDAAPGADWIELLPAGRDDTSSGAFLLSIDAALADPLLTVVGADKTDPVDPARRALLASRLGVEPLRLADTQGVVSEILLDRKWCPLRPTHLGRIEAWLGGEKWIDIPHVAGGATASSSFTGTENPLSEGGMWETGGGSWGELQKIAGQVFAVLDNVDSSARLITPSIGANQFSEAITEEVVSGLGTLSAGMACRMSAGTNETAYLGFVDYEGSNFLLFRVNSSFAFTELGSGSGAPVSGRTLYFEVSGTSLVLKENGVTVRTNTNAVIASGQPGLYIDQDPGVVAAIDPIWSGGDLGGEAVRSMFNFRRRRV